MTYSVLLEPEAEESFLKLDKGVRSRISKKLIQLQREDLSSRHLGFGSPFFVEEVGGYRITFQKLEEQKTKRVIFIGDHKQYEKWFLGQ